MRPSTKAWGVLVAGVAAYDVLSPRGETLSEGIDGALEGSPYKRAATLGAIAITALHLSNALPERYDPFHYALAWKNLDQQA